MISRSLLNTIAMPRDAGFNPAWLDHFERNVALFLLLHQPESSPLSTAADDDTALVPETADAAVVGGRNRIDALVDYIDSRLAAPVSLEDLARAAGVSVRTLNELCRRQYGATPMELLRNRRLDAARSRLRMQPDANITDTALAYGFGHLGRFSRYYQGRFGELPRQTQTKMTG